MSPNSSYYSYQYAVLVSIVSSVIKGMHYIVKCHMCIFAIGVSMSEPFIESGNISLDSPLEMYSKFVLAYQFWSAKSWKMADCYFKLWSKPHALKLQCECGATFCKYEL